MNKDAADPAMAQLADFAKERFGEKFCGISDQRKIAGGDDCVAIMVADAPTRRRVIRVWWTDMIRSGAAEALRVACPDTDKETPP